MRVLVVYAHNEDTSLNASVQGVTVRTLEHLGHKVAVSDLYRQRFNPLLGRHDIVGEPVDAANFRYSLESKVATDEGRQAPDIRVEQEKVMGAEIVIFQFPLYWMGLPAILKGWFDRVFTQGFAFGLDSMFDLGRFKGKKAMLSLTAGGTRGWFTSTGPMGDIEVSLWPIQNSILRFVGFDVLSPHIIFGTEGGTREEFAVCLQKWETRLRTLHMEKPLDYFLPMSAFVSTDPDSFMNECHVRPEVANRKSMTVGPTIGQHMGRPLPVGSMYRPATKVDALDLSHDVTGSSAT